jgi:hypothetical protein
MLAVGRLWLVIRYYLEIHLKQGTKVKRDKGTKFGFFFSKLLLKKNHPDVTGWFH